MSSLWSNAPPCPKTSSSCSTSTSILPWLPCGSMASMSCVGPSTSLSALPLPPICSPRSAPLRLVAAASRLCLTATPTALCFRRRPTLCLRVPLAASSSQAPASSSKALSPCTVPLFISLPVALSLVCQGCRPFATLLKACLPLALGSAHCRPNLYARRRLLPPQRTQNINGGLPCIARMRWPSAT